MSRDWPKSYQAASVPGHFPGCPLHCSARTNLSFFIGGDQMGPGNPFIGVTAAKASAPALHETEDEFFHVVKGEFKVKLGDHIMTAPAGSVMFVPRIIPIDLPNNASVKFSHLILLDTKFSRQIFNFAKCIFPFSNCDAVFTSRFFRKYHELPH
jgi:Cupin domain